MGKDRGRSIGMEPSMRGQRMPVNDYRMNGRFGGRTRFGRPMMPSQIGTGQSMMASQIGTGRPMVASPGQSFVQGSLGSSRGDESYDAFSDFNNDGVVTTSDFGSYMQANPGGQASMIETPDAARNRMMGERFARQREMTPPWAQGMMREAEAYSYGGRPSGQQMSNVPSFGGPNMNQMGGFLSGSPAPYSAPAAGNRGKANSGSSAPMPAPIQRPSPMPEFGGSSLNSMRPQNSLSGSAGGKANSGRSMGMADGGLIRGYQDGGIMGSMMQDPVSGMDAMAMESGEITDAATGSENEMLQIVLEAKAALEGRHPDPEYAVERFVEVFGEDELMSLKEHVIQSVENGGEDFMSDGMSDSLPGSIDGVEQVALSEGEYVVPADVVSGLGNGDTNSGAERMRRMIDDVRVARNGSPQQPPAVDPSMMMPV
jgi:hypothetical protein